MFRRSALYLLPAALVSLLTGCGVFAPHDIACTADPKFAFKLSVRDSVTNAFSLAGATIVWSSASRTDSLTFAPGTGGTDPGYANIDAPPGTYNLTVRKLQYRDWRRSGVEVGSNRCGTLAARIDVLLQPVVLQPNMRLHLVMDDDMNAVIQMAGNGRPVDRSGAFRTQPFRGLLTHIGGAITGSRSRRGASQFAAACAPA